MGTEAGDDERARIGAVEHPPTSAMKATDELHQILIALLNPVVLLLVHPQPRHAAEHPIPKACWDILQVAPVEQGSVLGQVLGAPRRCPARNSVDQVRFD